jgi:hypothetical protein
MATHTNDYVPIYAMMPLRRLVGYDDPLDVLTTCSHATDRVGVRSIVDSMTADVLVVAADEHRLENRPTVVIENDIP